MSDRFGFVSRINPVIGVVLVVALLAAALAVFWPRTELRTVTADFPRSVSLYEGSDVRVLGVAVGKVETVTPMGTVVRVEMTYDADQPVPADAGAVIIAPSIVGDRYVQLTPAYDGGEVLPDDARLSIERTATPLELDEIFGALNELNIALGPEQTNRPVDGQPGPLTRLLDSTARNFGGQGAQFNQTIRDFGQLTQTLADNEDELFDSMSNIQDFTTTLAENDDLVRRFNDSLAAGSDVLAGEREELAQALESLGVAMGEIRTFVRDNRDSLGTNIDGLKRVTDTLVKRREELDEVLRVAPAALNNLYLAGNDRANTLDVRNNISELLIDLEESPVGSFCALLGASLGTPPPCTDTPEGPELPNLPIGAPRAGALPEGEQQTYFTGNLDPTLGGLLPAGTGERDEDAAGALGGQAQGATR